ncbi:MAG: class I SAM-dependent methyltransferase [Asgard group archaeon]|nr:class I SAM-dependent methyltransferase [Asgard group archaeon]
MKKKSSSNEYSLMEEYRKITPKYVEVKNRPWRDFQQYLINIGKQHSLPYEGVLVDIGTGNGRNLELLKDQEWHFLASDLSIDLLRNLVDLPIQKLHILNNDMRRIPIRENAADLILCIATAHHLENKKETIAVLRNISNILKPKGYVILSFWRRWKPDTLKKMVFDIIAFPIKKILNNKWRHGDIFLPWFNKDKHVVANRYYHLFTKRELLGILEASNLEICNITLAGGKSGKDNFFVLLQKNN